MTDASVPLSKTIKITEADFERLKAYGEPFESPGRALGRALDRAEEAGRLERENSAMMEEIERLRKRMPPGEERRMGDDAPRER